MQTYKRIEKYSLGMGDRFARRLLRNHARRGPLRRRGNDPAWADGGRRDAERDAWTRFSFGDFSATAQTRRDLLQRLVPKLKIAERCSFADKFLVVRGDLRI